MNKLAIGVVGVAVIAAGVTGAAYWSGVKAERWYEEALAESAKSGNVKLSTVRYQRGLFSSHIVTRVEIARPEGDDTPDLSFAIRQQVYHGPVPLAGWGTPGVPMQLTGAMVRATLDPDSSDWTRQLAQWYGDQEPILALLGAERIGVNLSDEFQLHPEQSTSALVVHHPRAKYFSV